MTFQPVLPWPILAVVAGALALARVVALRQVLVAAGRRRAGGILRWSGVTMGVLLVVAAATRPAHHDDQHREGTTSAAGENLNVFLIVDRSVDSGVDDYGGSAADGSRIAGMRDDMRALIEQYPAARYALVAFASRAALDWPLSEDVWSLRPSIAALRPLRSGPGAGLEVDAGAAATVLRYQLTQATQQYPGSRNVVLYLGSGAPGSRVPQGDFNLAQGSVDGGAVLGYGSPAAINETELRQVAGQLAVPYLHRQPGQALQLDLPDPPDAAGVRAEVGQQRELYWLPALLAGVLLLSTIFFTVREFRRGRIIRRDAA